MTVETIKMKIPCSVKLQLVLPVISAVPTLTVAFLETGFVMATTTVAIWKMNHHLVAARIKRAIRTLSRAATVDASV